MSASIAAFAGNPMPTNPLIKRRESIPDEPVKSGPRTVDVEGYKLLDLLGEGGMGSVWKAHQVSLNRSVAIKFLASDLSSNLSDIEQFYDEARLAAQLNHPGVIQVYDFNVVDGCYYFIMEYVEGYSVAEWLQQKGILTTSDALAVAESIAEALRYAWEKSAIVHCDIKPANVMVDSEGNIRVADLGLARTLSSMRGQSPLAEVMGTPPYMSPEQVRGEVNLDCRADIYSLGATLYEMLTGRPLFAGHADEDIMKMQLTHRVDDALDINPGLPRPVCALIEKMLAKDRDLRQADWESVLSDIRSTRKGILPKTHRLPADASTMRRSHARSTAGRTAVAGAAGLAAAAPAGSPWKKALLIGGVSLAVLVVILAAHEATQRSRAQAILQQQALQAQQQATDLYDSAERWTTAHPRKYDEAIKRFQDVAAQLPGSVYASRAGTRIKELRSARTSAHENALAALDQKTRALKARGEFARAAAVYETYTGPFAAETEARRMFVAQGLREQATRAKQSAIQFNTFLDGIVARLVSDGLDSAKYAMATALTDSRWPAKQRVLSDVARIIDQARRMDSRILNSFRAQVGQSVYVDFEQGRACLKIIRVGNGAIVCEDAAGASKGRQRNVGVKALALHERLRRMGSNSNPDVALVKGLIALDYGAHEKAKEYFAKTHPALRQRLIEVMKETEAGRR